jgi:hypothetical protein
MFNHRSLLKKRPGLFCFMAFSCFTLSSLFSLGFAEAPRSHTEIVDAQGDYHFASHYERSEKVEDIQHSGRDSQTYTTLNLNGQVYDVVNDSIKTHNGRYIPITFAEAKVFAKAWMCRIPTIDELKAIARYAKNNGNQLRAITRPPNNDLKSLLKSMNAMINDPLMIDRAQMGEERLIDGHFKWYDDKGRIFGFAKGDGSFWQNSPSSAHMRDPDYYDYSHGLRLICPKAEIQPMPRGPVYRPASSAMQ